MARLQLVLVWIVALALTASGAAWQKCAAAQSSPISSAYAHPAAAHEHAGHHHVHEQHHHGHDVDAADAPSGAHGDHGCAKCCGVCGIAAALPDNPSYQPLAGAVVLAISPQESSGSPVPVDPGIPKHFA